MLGLSKSWRKLVKLLSLFIHAQDADVADMMVAAGIHAPGDIDCQFADVVDPVHVLKAFVDFLGNRNRAGIGERAVVESGAGNDV